MFSNATKVNSYITDNGSRTEPPGVLPAAILCSWREGNHKKTTMLIILVILVCLLAACDSGPEPTEVAGTEPPPTHPVVETVSPFPITSAPSSTTGEATYYVSQTDCSDTGPGDEQTPFCSFETALGRLQPGDTLVIQAGTYTGRLAVTGLAGTAGAPIVIRGESRDGVVFDGACPDFPCSINDVPWAWDDETGMVSVQDSSFIVLRDLTVQNAIAAGVNVFGGTDIVVENITICGTGNAGMLFKYLSNLTVSHNDVGRAQLGWRDEYDDVQVGAHEALSIVGVDGFVVAHNYVHDTPKEGIDIKESSTDGDVHDNFVERACAVGIYVNEAHDVRVYQNRIRRSGYYRADDDQERLCGTEPVFGDLYGKYYGDGILLAVGDLGELSQGRLSNIQVYQNLVWDANLNCLQFWDELRENGTGAGEMTGNRVYNNVFYNCGFAGIRLDDVGNTWVVNNIIALNDEEGITGNATADNTISHNLFHFRHDWHQPMGTDYVVGDPLFVDPANGDFHLQEDSPAIDNGLDVGLPYTGNGPDIGAHEH